MEIQSLLIGLITETWTILFVFIIETQMFKRIKIRSSHNRDHKRVSKKLEGKQKLK